MVCARWPHHKRTRSSGEQRGTTVKATESDETRYQANAQFSSPTRPKCPQLPKLMAANRALRDKAPRHM